MQWYVKEGDTVAQFDPICEVQSDKATVDISSKYDGKIIKVHHEVGGMAKVGSPLVTLELEGEAAAPPAAEETAAAPSASKATASAWSSPSGAAVPSATTGKVLTTPAVRRLAREHSIDLTQVPATGPKGRLLKEDVLRFLDGGSSVQQEQGQQGQQQQQQQQQAPAQRVAVAPAAAAAPAAPAAAPAAPASPEQPREAIVRDYRLDTTQEKFTGLNRIMVKTMTAASEVPTMLLCDEIDMSELIDVRGKLKQLALDKYGIRLSYLPFLMKAASMAMSAYPRVNSTVDDECTEVTLHGSHNIGLAMDTPRGLLVPNVKNVQDRSVLEIASELNRLQALGAASKIGPSDLEGGTFTLSNIGSVGGTYASPILVRPQTVIGALGRTRLLPRFNAQGEVVPVSLMNVSWTADHRVLDGVTLTRFSNEWKRLLEDPAQMLMDLR